MTGGVQNVRTGNSKYRTGKHCTLERKCNFKRTACPYAGIVWLVKSIKKNTITPEEFFALCIGFTNLIGDKLVEESN